MLLSVVMCLRESLNAPEAAHRLESIIYQLIEDEKQLKISMVSIKRLIFLNSLNKIFKRRRCHMGKTLFDKVWNKHVLTGKEGDPQLLYIDLHLIHEVTSPQAFEGLRLQNRKLRRPDLTYATLDHNVPTVDIFNIKDEIANKQITTLQKCQRI